MFLYTIYLNTANQNPFISNFSKDRKFASKYEEDYCQSMKQLITFVK